MRAQNVMVVALLAAMCVASYGSALSHKHQLPAIYKDLVNLPRAEIKQRLQVLLSATERSALDDQLIALLESLRAGMGEPNPTLGLPALDPLSIDHFDIDIDQELATLKGSVDKVVMTKLKSFIIDSVKLNILLLSFSFGVTVPELEVKGDNYDIDGVVGGVLPVYGNGSFEVSLSNLSVTGTAKLGSNNSYIYLKSFLLDFNLGGIKVHFDGLLGGGDVGEVINEMINDALPGLIVQVKPQLLATLSDAVINLVNAKLDGMTLQDILDLINGKGGSSTTASPSLL